MKEYCVGSGWFIKTIDHVQCPSTPRLHGLQPENHTKLNRNHHDVAFLNNVVSEWMRIVRNADIDGKKEYLDCKVIKL